MTEISEPKTPVFSEHINSFLTAPTLNTQTIGGIFIRGQ
jgi:hypothetical protein